MPSIPGGDVAARLRVELARLQPLNPFQVLELAPDAEPEAIRRAFLGLTKRYHPARFARESADTVDVANEVFLVIRKAYAQLSDETRRRGWRERVAATTRSFHVTPLKVTPLKVEPVRVHGTPPPENARPRHPTTQPPVAVSPTTGRTEEQVRALLEEARTRGHRFEQASRAIGRGNYAEARELLVKLVNEDPQSRRYRHKLYLATGLEHRDAGRPDDAIRELERAVTLESGPGGEASEALKKLLAERKGLFGKLFGR